MKSKLQDRGFDITPKERKRRDRVFRDAIASCTIEGLHLSTDDKAEVRRVYRSCASSDDMIKHLKESMGVK